MDTVARTHVAPTSYRRRTATSKSRGGVLYRILLANCISPARRRGGTVIRRSGRAQIKKDQKRARPRRGLALPRGPGRSPTSAGPPQLFTRSPIVRTRDEIVIYQRILRIARILLGRSDLLSKIAVLSPDLYSKRAVGGRQGLVYEIDSKGLRKGED
ncbi:hypothetical protein EVAR_92130_1 [Eumeta japonica]|uniref:Uncharacterized protein n=1 Tax=Eumeta variegata TaxID=151549 RepID=A0A4C1T135_EUMVA|nr:hypothetical protein EVAR_92130_1 [Eumeta japonica]